MIKIPDARDWNVRKEVLGLQDLNDDLAMRDPSFYISGKILDHPLAINQR